MTDQKASCPYAVSLSDDEDAGSTELLEMAMTSCPAFAESGSCPFKDAKNADQVRHALLDVPPSHLEKKGHFTRALRHLHHVSQTLQLGDSKFAVAGGCPVQSYSPDTSFAGAMEEYSLASIMARMAQDLEEQEEHDHEQEGITTKRRLKKQILLQNRPMPSTKFACQKH